MELGNIEFGKLWKYTDDSPSVAIPILRKTIKKRNYKMLQEVKDKLNIKDSGRINKIEVSSKIDEPVFVRGGTMFKGQGTQSRSSNFGIVILPNKQSVPIEASCIQASAGIVGGGTFYFGYETVVPHNTYKCMLSSSTTGHSAQSEVWNSVARVAEGANLSGLSDDLIGNLEKINKAKKDINEIIKKIPTEKTQVGLAIIDLQGVYALEMFDSPKSWKAIAEDIFKRYTDKLVEKYERPLFKMDEKQLVPTVMNFLKSLTEGDRKLLFEDGKTKTYALSTKKSMGEYTRLNGDIIHFIGMRKEKTNNAKRRGTVLTTTDSTTFNWETPTSTSSYSEGVFVAPTEYQVLSYIDKGMNGWANLKGKVNVSPNTLSGKIKSLEKKGLIKTRYLKNDRRKKKYETTAKGKHILMKLSV